MKITATIMLSIFSILSVSAQTSAPVFGTQKSENVNPVHTGSTDKNSTYLGNSYTKQIGVKRHGELGQMIREHHFTRHLFFAVLFFRDLDKQDAGARNKMDYYRGKSLKFK